MKIYTLISPSHYELGKGWEKTIQREPLAEPKKYLIPIQSDGDYRNEQWNEILILHEVLTAGIIHENIGSIIGVTGVDVRFIKPFVDNVRSMMEIGFDFLFQDEDGTGKYWNPDVMFVRCTPETLRKWVRYTLLLPHWNGHMNHQNALMKCAGIRGAHLPIEYASTLNGGADMEPFLYHANNLHAPGCVAQKLEALKKYE